jgi:malate dehydrogenase (oxaloacetate-decarboxylating)(NADP+)
MAKDETSRFKTQRQPEEMGGKILSSTKVEAALEFHRGTTIPAGAGTQRAGKIEVISSKSLLTQRDLSYAYSPGVAEPCKAIFKDPELAYSYTAKGNLVGVVTNGTAILGLGSIGPLAGKPVMEGKAVLFKKFADIDCFDIEVDSADVDSFVQTVASLEPTFGGINLEDIKAPECFEIEKRLREKMQIPVFHDDQHGTAIISGAALLNALEVFDKKIETLKVVFCGGGAASIACAKFWLSLGVKKENVIMTDRLGVITSDRTDEMNPFKAEFAISGTSWHKKQPKTLKDAMVGADVFMGCSAGNVVTPEMLKSLAPNCIVFAMANPDPEISYEEAIRVRTDMIFATGRSDYPNQVNNVLGFPFIFRGALDVRARTVNEEMKIAAARALALLAKQEIPESVIQAYGGQPLRFGKDYIIPKPFDPRALLWVAPAVAKAAIDSGVARLEMPGGSEAQYKNRLEKLLGKGRSIMRDIRDRIEVGETIRKIRIVFPEGTHEKILKAAEIIKEEGLAEPILLGPVEEIQEIARAHHLETVLKCEMIRPSRSPLHPSFSEKFWELRKRKGCTPGLAQQLLKDPLYFGAMCVRMGQADAWLSGVSRSYPETIRPSLQVVGSSAGVKISGVYMLIWKDRVIFLADTTVNFDPTAEELADIAINAARVAQALGFDPRVAMLSFSNFGSNDHPEALKVRKAAHIVQRRRPDLIVDGEIQADAAVNPKVLRDRFPFCRLGEISANVLICPNLSSANIAYKLLAQLGGAELVGPILVGMNLPMHVLQLNAEVTEIVNMAIITVLDAQRHGLHKKPIGVPWDSALKL